MTSDLHPLLIPAAEINVEEVAPLWAYLTPPPANLLGFSPFGDWFLKATDGRILRIDLLEGQLDQVAASQLDFRATLATDVGADQLLLAGLVESLARGGMVREAGQCYAYGLHPRLGGAIAKANIRLSDHAVWQRICSQLHPQIDAAPPAAVFSGLDLSPEGELIVRWA